MKQLAQQLAPPAAFVKRWLFWLLVGSYALGAALPAPGRALREWQVDWLSVGGAPARFSLWMVAVLLFSGAVSVDLSRLWELARRPMAVAMAMVGVWAPPVLLVALWGALLGWVAPEGAVSGVMLGVALVAAMPVANSAVGWTQQSDGSLVWALGLVVLSISLCPLAAPQLLKLMGLTLSTASAAEVDAIVSSFTGGVFIVWVLAPTLIGFAVRWAVGGARIVAVQPVLVLASAAALLLLNYANASMALPRLTSEHGFALLVTAAVVAVTLPIAGWGAGWWLAPLARVSQRSRMAWGYSLGMKNTGLALSLADTALGDQPIAVVVILLSTLTQHAVASLAHAWRRLPHGPSSEYLSDPCL